MFNYLNGNVYVQLFDDGTKMRFCDNTPQPMFPESIDLKITNYCDAACPFCHERSTVHGRHSNLDNVLEWLRVLPAGVEIAIGGGNPLSHPQILPFLQTLREFGLVANMTVNYKHIHDITEIRPLIYGLGVSYQGSTEGLDHIWNANTILHMIAGVHTVDQLHEVLQWNPTAKILILGYKTMGRGIAYQYRNAIEENIRNWRRYIPYITAPLLYDNLAVEQLEIRRMFTDKTWDTFYMGNDGAYTMYVDAVANDYAKSSTGKRFPFNGDIFQAFAHVRELL